MKCMHELCGEVDQFPRHAAQKKLGAASQQRIDQHNAAYITKIIEHQLTTEPQQHREDPSQQQHQHQQISQDRSTYTSYDQHPKNQSSSPFNASTHSNLKTN